MADSLADSERLVRVQRETGVIAMAGHTPALQSEPPMGAQAHPGGGIEGPADGRADVFFPAHEHERARQTAQLDRPPALASRLSHRGPVPVPDRRDHVGVLRAAGPEAPRARHRHGHEHRAQGALGRASAPCRCPSTTTARWAPFSAISATTAPTSPAMTSCCPVVARLNRCFRRPPPRFHAVCFPVIAPDRDREQWMAGNPPHLGLG